MCGILFLTSKEARANKAVAKRYRQQRARGTNGYGYLTIKDGKIENVARNTTENGIMHTLKHETAPAILFHHRTPTSTPNYAEVTHPFYINDDRFAHDYYIIHNGVISNWEAMYEEYKKEGYKFVTEMCEASSVRFPNIDNTCYEFDPEIRINDSEALAINLARYFEGMTETIMARGTIAFIAVQTDKAGNVERIMWGHNDGNPLKIEQDKTLFCLRSEGNGTNVPVDIIYTKDWHTGEVTEQPVKIGDYYARKTGFDHTRDVPARSMWDEAEEKTTERHLHPTHPMLPMGQSIKEMGQAMARTKAREDDMTGEYAGGPSEPGYNSAYWSDFDPENSAPSYYDDMIQDNEVDRMLGENMGESEQAQELRKDLRKALYEAGAAAQELSDARELLRAAIRDTLPITELESARAMVQTANEQLNVAKREINNITAELSAY